MTIEELQKQFEDYKKIQEEQLKKKDEEQKKQLEALEESHKKETQELKEKMFQAELSKGIDSTKEPVAEEDKVVTWNDIAKEVGKE